MGNVEKQQNELSSTEKACEIIQKNFAQRQDEFLVCHFPDTQKTLVYWSYGGGISNMLLCETEEMIIDELQKFENGNPRPSYPMLEVLIPSRTDFIKEVRSIVARSKHVDFLKEEFNMTLDQLAETDHP